MEKKLKIVLLRVFLSTVILVSSVFVPDGIFKTCFLILAYAISGYDVLWNAFRNILNGQVFDENFLMSLATVGALLIGEYPEAVFVMVFYQVGEVFQDVAVNKSTRSIMSLMDIRPDYANIERDGEIIKVSPEEVEIGDVIYIKPGEKIPLDSIVIEGASSLNTSALTGESIPRDIEIGDEVISGCVNLSGLLKAKVTKNFSESTVSKILELIENSSFHKAKSEKFITKFSRYYTPIVVILALILAILPSLIFGNFSEWLHRALIFLVISCPCALVISVPLSFFSGIGCASKNGILVKGGNFLETLSSCKTVVLDKTGTVTKGVFSVVSVEPVGNFDRQELLKLSAHAENYSTHPIALSLREAYKGEIEVEKVGNVEEISGKGIKAEVFDKEVAVGNTKLMESLGFEVTPPKINGTVVFVSVDNEYAGCIVISDEIKEDSKDAIKNLKSLGISKVVMLTGDRKEAAEEVGKELEFDIIKSELLPIGKVEALEELLEEKEEGSSLVFVGDGINDAPVISLADVGIAMGGLGSDAAIEASDVVLMNDKLSSLSLAIKISKRTKKIVWQNIIFALTVKAIVLIMGACGIATMWEAVFADVGVSVIAILNSMRALKIKE